MKRYLVERFTPDVVEEEVKQRLGDLYSEELTCLMSYHVCIRLKYSRITMIKRFNCLPSMVTTLEGELKRIYNEVLFCFDVHDSQNNARI